MPMGESWTEARHEAEPSYTVREAVLVRTKDGSAWTIRFATTGEDSDEVIVVIGPEQLDEMAFARLYSLAEITALTAGRVHIAEEPSTEG
jgi:hypothetical protein